MHFKQNCAYQDNKGNYWFVRWVDKSTLVAHFLNFVKPHCLPSDWIEEYRFDSQTGEIQIAFLPEKSDIKLKDEIVLDYNIKPTLFNRIKNCIKRLCTRPANFEKFDMVYCLSLKEPGVIITKEELDNQFLVYYPISGLRQWEHASDLEFMFKPVNPVKSNANHQ